MKIVTFNIRCDYEQDGTNNFSFRKPVILEKIKNEEPDIICFQEVLPHVSRWLKKNLNDYYVVGCGRNETLEDEHTSIAYNKLKFDLLDMQVFWLSETPNIPGSRYKDQSKCPRTCTVALLQDIETKQVFHIYNTHLDHKGQESRELGLSQILEMMEKQDSFIEAPAILLGDFNAIPDSKELELLKSYPELVDISATVDGTFHDFGRRKEADKIDYIIAHDSIVCKEISIWSDCVNGVYLSDHYPICAVVQI